MYFIFLFMKKQLLSHFDFAYIVFQCFFFQVKALLIL